MSRRPLVAGNWKMNGSTEQCAQLLQGLLQGFNPDYAKHVDCVVFPSFLQLSQAVAALNDSSILVGSQGVVGYDSGAYTGGVSAKMCAEAGCQLVLAGHSERRHVFRETDQDVAAQVDQVLNANMIPVICVGETEQEREADETLSVIKRQLAAVLSLEDNRRRLTEWVVAYEPVWAIGTGKRATPSDIVQVHQFIRDELAAVDSAVAADIRILYGGSVKPDNASDLFDLANVDGALVGGASLSAKDFLEIVSLCCK